MSNRIVFSVVLPTFNRPEHLVRCLEALARQDFPKHRFEVIVVDDGGKKPLDRLVRVFRKRLRLKLLRQSNGGCASARWFGIGHAQGEYLAFTDDDCRPEPDWLTRIEAALKGAPDCAVGGPTVNGAVDDLYAEATQSIVETLTLAGRDSAGYFRYGPTSNLVFPAVLFSAMGGLDPRWRIAGGEDRDLCARWIQAGHRLFFTVSARVMHYHRLTLRCFLRQHFHYGRGAWRYYTGFEPLRRFESPALYGRLFMSPLRAHPVGRGLTLCGLILLAQVVTGAGLLAEALSAKGNLAREPLRSAGSVNVQAKAAKHAG